MNRELFAYRGAKHVFALIACLTVIQGASIIGQAVYLSQAITRLFAGRPLQSIRWPMIYFFVALAVRYCCVLVVKLIAERFAERTSSTVRKTFLVKLFQLGPNFVNSEGTGNLVNLALEGVAQMRQYLELFLPKMAANGIVPVMILIAACMIDRVSALILLVTMPILVVFMILLGLAAQKKMDDRWASYRVLSNHFLDSLRGLTTLRYLGLSRMHVTSIRYVSDRYRRMTMRTLSLAFMSSFALDFFSMLSIAVVAVFLGVRLINGQILLEPALAVLILAPEYFLPVRELGQDYHATLDGKEAASRLSAYIARTNAARGDDAKPVLMWNEHSRLTVQALSFTYASATEPAIRQVSFAAEGFEKIGLIGASGSGKSTLIDLVGGFLKPATGDVRIDGALTDLNALGWQNQLTYIPQHPYLFSGSLRDNIAFYAPNSTADAVQRAVAAAGLKPLINAFPSGLDERIGAGGRQLSGGQEQRVALARAFLCNRPILLLDEPTAHLDVETEYELKETMVRLFAGKLVIMATHRLHWMEQMDRVVVMQDGRIAESGTQSALLGAGGVYAALVRSQLEGVQ
ncbi:MAG: thiol reductant ABC exporter subunit CydD [Sporolactobacillus sp.]